MSIGIADFVLPPSLDRLVLLQYLFLFTFLIHLLFICTIMGGAVLSLFFNILDRDRPNPKYLRFAKDLMDKLAINKGAAILLGIIPMAVIILFFWQMLYGNPISNTFRCLVVLALLFFAFIFLYIYKDTFSIRDKWFLLHIGSGLWGVLLLMGAYFFFMANKNFILYPELWKTINDPATLIFASNILPAYLYFILTAFAISGGAILLFIGLSSQGDTKEDEQYRSFARKVALYLILVCTLLQPIIGSIELIVLPEPVVSNWLLAFRVIGLLLGMLICLTVCLALARPQREYEFCSKSIAILLFDILLVFIGTDYIGRNNVLREQILFLYAKAEESAPMKRGVKLDEVGREVFQASCVACHSIDGSKAIGPTFKGIWGRKGNVITNGSEREILVDEAYLKKSLQNPSSDIVKGYQNLMPPQNLSEQKINGVIEYLKTLK